MNVTQATLKSARRADQDRGLLAFVEVELDGDLALSGLTLRRTLDGRLVMSFPAKRDASGTQRFFVRPTNDEARREFERQVLSRLGIADELA